MSNFSKEFPQFLVTPSGGLGFEHYGREVTIPTVEVNPVTGRIRNSVTETEFTRTRPQQMRLQMHSWPC